MGTKDARPPEQSSTIQQDRDTNSHQEVERRLKALAGEQGGGRRPEKAQRQPFLRQSKQLETNPSQPQQKDFRRKGSSAKSSPPSRYTLSLRVREILLNKKIVQNETNPEGLLHLVKVQLGRRHADSPFSSINVATWLNRWVKLEGRWLRGPAPPELLALLRRLEHLLKEEPESFTSWSCSVLVNALTKLDYDEWLRWTPQLLLSSFLSAPAASPGPRQAPPPRTATASKDNDVQRVLNRLVDRMSSLGLASFSEQGLATVMNGLGRADHHPGKEFLDNVVAEVLERRGGFKEFTPQGVSKLLNGFARLGHSPGVAFNDLVVDYCMRQQDMSAFQPVTICMLLNGLTKLDYRPPSFLMDKFAREIVSRDLSTFTEQGLSTLINAYNKAMRPTGGGAELAYLVEALADEAYKRGFECFTEQGLGIFLHGLARLWYRPSDAFTQEAARVFVSGLESGGFEQGQHMYNMIDALASFKHHPGRELLDAFFAAGDRRGWAHMNLQERTLSMWSLECMGTLSSPGLVRATAHSLREWRVKLESELGGERLTEESKARHEVISVLIGTRAVKQLLVLRDAGPGEDPVWDELRAEAERLWDQVLPLDKSLRHPPISQLQEDAGRFLREIGKFETQEEVLLMDGLLSVDYLLTIGGMKVAVEVDGKVHFYVNDKQVLTAGSRFKRRMLNKAVEKGEVSGYVTLPYWDVPELSKLDRQGMTQMLLSRAALLPRLQHGGKRQEPVDEDHHACEERKQGTRAVGGRS